MVEYIIYGLLLVGFTYGLFFIVKRLYLRYKTSKDYNRVLNSDEKKLKEDLDVLRREILLTDSPYKRNELIRKIDVLSKRSESEL
jgi:hypothetical protein